MNTTAAYTGKLYINGAEVYLDFVLMANRSLPVVYSYYARSISTVKAIGANLNLAGKTVLFTDGNRKQFQYVTDPSSDATRGWTTKIQPMVKGKERFYHAVSVHPQVGKNILLCSEDELAETWYDYLMHNYKLPLLKDWKDAMCEYAKDKYLLTNQTVIHKGNEEDICPFEKYKAYQVSFSAELLNRMIESLFSSGKIRIAYQTQKKMDFDNMDQYFKQYGHTLVDNLQKEIQPLSELSGEAKNFTLRSKRLYPQQIATVNGDVALLFDNHYVILNHGMGTGKTLCAGTVCEKYFVEKYLKSHPKKTIKDVYENPDCIGYRVIIMCPGHLVVKWAEELRNEIPYAKTTIISDFSQLIQLREEGKERKGREFYVISKDFGKLSYQMEPTPVKRRYQRVFLKECADCGTAFNTPGSVCPSCKSQNYKLKKTHNKKEGMVCPHCSQLLFPYLPISPDNGDVMPLDFDGFNAQKQSNSRCYYCDTELWQPHVANLGVTEKKHPWVRVSHYANASKKGTKTDWMLKPYMEQHLARIGKKALNIIEDEGCRKYSPVLFIKKYLKGYFDIAIFDEAHVYKGGRTGQGHAMHALIKASKKQLALTGTIAGGCANHLFYLLYRLEPKRMLEKGFRFYDEMKFSEMYGKVERTYQYNGNNPDAEYKASCKGRQIGSPKVKPGISPLIFTDFLLDRTTFLDLSDMSRHLPKLEEKVVTVDCNDREAYLLRSYRDAIDKLTRASRQKGGGRGILSTMLQFSLSYMDKPFDLKPILNPESGEVLLEPDNYPVFKDTSSFDNLLAKEQKLVELVREEISQGRNVFVYAEYTASPELCITYRLKEILERHCGLSGQVEVLESASPAASKREEWIHKKAQQGIRVFITNPKCVETGLDFCFNVDGVTYNYPTIVFYQLGYSLFTIWQASRRAYRLNQKENCKTIYMAWANTTQQAVIELIAEKQAATAVIQGKFSTEGLSAMANGMDASIKLAQSMSQKDMVSQNQLQQMFDVLAVSEDSNMAAEYKPMLLLHELIDVAEKEQPVVQTTYDLLNMSFEMFLMAQNQAMPSAPVSVPVAMRKKVKRTNNKVLAGQMSLF